jgi:hypothetical protein
MYDIKILDMFKVTVLLYILIISWVNVDYLKFIDNPFVKIFWIGSILSILLLVDIVLGIILGIAFIITVIKVDNIKSVVVKLPIYDNKPLTAIELPINENKPSTEVELEIQHHNDERIDNSMELKYEEERNMNIDAEIDERYEGEQEDHVHESDKIRHHPHEHPHQHPHQHTFEYPVTVPIQQQEPQHIHPVLHTESQCKRREVISSHQELPTEQHKVDHQIRHCQIIPPVYTEVEQPITQPITQPIIQSNEIEYPQREYPVTEELPQTDVQTKPADISMTEEDAHKALQKYIVDDYLQKASVDAIIPENYDVFPNPLGLQYNIQGIEKDIVGFNYTD